MAYVLEDRVLESTTSTGTGPLALAGAVVSFRRFSAVCGIGDTAPYFVEAIDTLGQPTGDYEYGLGTYTAANQLTRTLVLGSSNAGAAVNFAAGTKNIGIALNRREVDYRTRPGFRNRLINGNFSVNQRAVAGAVVLAAGAYGHDRWKAGAGGCTYTFATSGAHTIITISAGSLMQVIEDKNVEGGTYALANQGTAQARIAVNGAATSGAYAAATSTSPLISGSATGGQAMSVEFSTGTIDRAQLESGTVATPWEHRPASAELTMCQRYYQTHAVVANGQIACGQALTTGNAYFGVNFQVPMRATPTIAQIAPLFRLGGEVLGAFSLQSSSRDGFTVTVAPTTTFAVNAAVLVLQGSAPTQPVWTASAEL